ncbi:MAG: hypothetical protein WA949_23590 [Phormidesmis sp.]
MSAVIFGYSVRVIPLSSGFQVSTRAQAYKPYMPGLWAELIPQSGIRTALLCR